MDISHLSISSQLLLTLGGIFLISLLLSTIAQRSFLPRAGQVPGRLGWRLPGQIGAG
jgi:hypothetical protein